MNFHTFEYHDHHIIHDGLKLGLTSTLLWLYAHGCVTDSRYRTRDHHRALGVVPRVQQRTACAAQIAG